MAHTGILYSVTENDTPETIRANGGFDFELLPEKAGYVNDGGNFIALPKRKILRRSDTGAAIAVVGDGYKAHQPAAILDFFLSFAVSFGLKLASVGVIDNGRRYWAFAKTSISAALNGDNDRAELFAMLSTACDGSSTTLASPVANRPYCNNQWEILLRYANAQVKKGNASRQSHRSDFSNERAAEGFGFDIDASASAFEAQCAIIRELNHVKVDDETAKQWFRDLLRPKAEREMEARGEYGAQTFGDLVGAPAALRAHKAEIAKEPRGLDALIESYNNAPGARPGTARGLWEASTHYIDHVRGTDDAARMKSALFGQGNDIKARAWENVTALLN